MVRISVSLTEALSWVNPSAVISSSISVDASMLLTTVRLEPGEM